MGTFLPGSGWWPCKAFPVGTCLASSGCCPFSLLRPPLTLQPSLLLHPSACFGRGQAPTVLTGSQATPGGHRSPGLSPSPFPCVWTWKICDVLPESHCPDPFCHHLGHFSAIRTCMSKISSLGGETKPRCAAQGWDPGRPHIPGQCWSCPGLCHRDLVSTILGNPTGKCHLHRDSSVSTQHKMSCGH